MYYWLLTSSQSTTSSDRTPGQVLTTYLEAQATSQLQLHDVFSMEQYCNIRGLFEL